MHKVANVLPIDRQVTAVTYVFGLNMVLRVTGLKKELKASGLGLQTTKTLELKVRFWMEERLLTNLDESHRKILDSSH